MKTVKHRKVDSVYMSDDDMKVIKTFMEDEREGKIDYLGNWSELMNVMEIIADELHVEFVMERNAWVIKHRYKIFSKTFMWHDYKTRQSALFLVIVDFIKWWNLKEWDVIDRHYRWLKEQEMKKK